MSIFRKKEEQDGEVLQEEIYVNGIRVYVVDDVPEEDGDQDEQDA